MKKGVDYQKVEMTEQEYEYYQDLVKLYGAQVFSELFETDKNGTITIIKPTKSIPWEVLFFIQNVMINQHLRANDERISALERKLEALK